MLHPFAALPIVRLVHRAGALPAEARGYAADTITLGWEERLRTRGRRRSDSGVAFGTALERGTVLRAGDCLVLDAAATVVEVRERPEPVLVIAPADESEWALFGYHIGNGHQPMMIDGGAIVCAELPGMAELLDYHRIPFTRDVRPFTPVGAAVAGHRHQP